MNPKHFISLCFLFLFTLISSNAVALRVKQTVKYKITDGYGNMYQINESQTKSLQYTPIGAVNSTVENYDGGQSMYFNLKDIEYAQIEKLIKRAHAAKKSQTKSMITMVATIQINEKANSVSFMMKPKSKEWKQLNDYFTKLKTRYRDQE